MRYEDWDLLLFPKDSKVPLKEFKTQCHVVQDTEFAYTHGSYGLPTMTCFIPGLRTGSAFNISMHSWIIPEVSQFTKNNFNKHGDLVVFEARVFIDGRLVATASVNRDGSWPQLINHGFEFNRNGDLEHLKFPSFRSELLRQSYWSPADELGRIKIIISEGFPRDSLTVPIERVKNLVAFSFQHAPLDILESSGIAWPNPAMWRRGPFNPTMSIPAEQHGDGFDSHTHSPRRRSARSSKFPIRDSNVNFLDSMKDSNADFLDSMPNTQTFLQNTTFVDPFDSHSQSNSSADVDWTTGLVPSDFATTLTNSLLNQPMPAPRQSSSTSSPPSARTFSGVFSSRSASGIAEFGQNLTNVNPVATFINPDSNGDKTAKRSRHATPASNRALEDDDVPKRSTPQVKIGFGEDPAN
ncbi:hypothetical protein SCUP234_06984 [Seiridium cupressi]